MLNFMYLILGGYCFRPNHRILSSLRKEFGTKWKHVGYILGLDHSSLTNIEINSHEIEERAFKMLVEWLERDVESCYCKLISAMNEEGLCEKVDILKHKIKNFNGICSQLRS